MSVEIALSGPVPSGLRDIFSTEPPTKRRKSGKAICDAERAQTLLPEYLVIASLTLQLRFEDYDDDSGYDETNAGFAYDDSPVPVIPKIELLRDNCGQPDRVTLLAERHGAVFDAPIELHPQDARYIDTAAQVGSIFRPTSKPPPACCSRATLKRLSDQKWPAFQLDINILWRDSLAIPEKLSSAAATAFATLVRGEDTPSSCVPDNADQQLLPSEFYDSVHVPDKSLDLPASVGIDEMPSRLFPFQRRSVRWLLEREGIELSVEGKLVPRESVRDPQDLPASFFKLRDMNGRVCYASHVFRTMTTDVSKLAWVEPSLRGGILAEEMGLGKTLELLTLISLHRRPLSDPVAFAEATGLVHSGATLIVTPAFILEQWKQEIRMHAPDLRFVYYEGIGKSAEDYDQQVQELAACDIVLTTYNVLRREIHFAETPPARSMRHERKFERPKSPLVQISWWRVCIDEAQMIESGVSGAAKVARIIPRCNAWAVSGTPLRKDLNDLFGLLLFLRYEPFCYSSDLWARLCRQYKPVLKTIVRKLVLRHNKSLIGDELRLPPQKRIVITVPFTAVEEQNYDQLFQQMCDECGLDVTGAPAVEHWSPSSTSTIEKMRSWLSRLRQACLHAKVSMGPGKAFGGGGPLRSVEDVLKVMIEQNDIQIRAEERALLLSQIRRGQLLENALKPKEALRIWQDALARCQPIVDDCQAQLEAELRKRGTSSVPGTVDDDALSDISETDDEKEGKDSTLGKYRQRLRAALEVQHMCKFFIASAYYQIKTNTELTVPDSEEFKALERLEEDTYEAAKLIRREMLSETNRKVTRYINLVREKVEGKGLVEIPEMSLDVEEGGIESRRIVDRVDEYCDIMNKQAAQFIKWRGCMSKLLLQPLIDEEDGAELQGDEYESSTKHQDELYVYMEALRVMFANLHDSVNGQTNVLIAHEIRQGLEMARQGGGPSPELYISVMNTCKELAVPMEIGSLRDILSELRSLVTSLGGQEIRGSSRARAELVIVNGILRDVGKTFSVHTKILSTLEREVELFRGVMNRRLEYYRQLQQISDTVAPYDEESRGKPLDVEQFELKKGMEDRIESKISSLRAKHRYLIHLRDESGADESQRICIICQSSFEIGVLTVCGHKYCKDCLRLWWHQHRTCPTCKTHLRTNDFHQITYKSMDIVAQEEKTAPALAAGDSRGNSHTNSIYEDVSSGVLQEIKNIDIRGSFGTKIDTLARHLIWLRQHDPGAKSIVFSQYKNFLQTLASAFSRFRIGYASIDSRDGIERFKRDSSIECFLLHAKAHSSGLNLVNATHVFLCEPLINTALELQAIARVHRIGQHRETTVWMYLVSDSVEESIYDISVSRRLAHIAQKQKESKRRERKRLNGATQGSAVDLTNISENAIESANTLELQDAALGRLLAGPATEGERVNDDDLWQCLFGKTKKNGVVGDGGASEFVENEVGRMLRADAAESRLQNGAS